MENYFLLLELKFDPPEEDTGRIVEAIEKKRNFWSTQVDHPIFGCKYRDYIEQIEKIKTAMLNPESRKKAATEAKQIKEREKEKLKGLLRSKYGNVERLTTEDIDKLVKLFGKFGFSPDEIRMLHDELRRQAQRFDFGQVLEKSYHTELRGYMRLLNLSDKTLYDFLELSPNASCEQLCNAARGKKERAMRMGEKTAENHATKELAELCKRIFKSAEHKRKYNNYIKLTKYGVVNDAIEEFAHYNKGHVEYAMKEELMDTAVRNYRISVSEASIYIDNYCKYMGYKLADNKTVCGLCSAENTAGAMNCSQCGKPLIIRCPSCSAENSNSAEACVNCGFDFKWMSMAAELIRKAKEEYAKKALDEAERLLKQAKVYWPNHVDILNLEKNIDDDRKRALDTIAAIKEDIQKKNLYAAQEKIDRAKANGISIETSVVNCVEAGLKTVETKLAEMRNTSGDEAFQLAMELRKLIADSDELKASLAGFPPKEVTGLKAKRVGTEIVLTWNKSGSIGEISYIVVRKENTYPNGPVDGVRIYSGKEQSCTDSRAPQNAVLQYSVFTERIGVYSKAARLSEAIAIVKGVTNPKAIGGDQMITLSWRKDPAATEIRIYKSCSHERPQDDSQYENVPCTRLDGLAVKGLTNGVNYWFAISAGYTINGRTYFSEKTYLRAVPQKPAKPLQDFSVQSINEVFLAKWTQSEWDVILLHANQKPEYAIGTVYDLNDLTEKYEKIDTISQSSTEARFKLNFVGECYIIPGVINGSNVILNEASYISAVPGVKDISFDMNPAATEMYITFEWPRSVDNALLIYRRDTYPTGIDDPLAQKVECSKDKYDINNGVVISKSAKGTFYVEVYTYVETSVHRVYSKACRILICNESKRDAYYTLKYNRFGIFNKKCTLTVKVETSGACVFPGFEIVSRVGNLPLSRSDGHTVCRVDEDNEINGSCTFRFEVSPMEQGTRLKMFFLNDKDYKSFKITCRAGDSI